MRWIAPLILFLSVNSVWAWGTQGHMVVAQIAENHLNPLAEKSVSRILKGQKMADVANWADSIKGKPQWSHTKPWHFVDIPDGEDYSTIEHSHEGDVVQAITEMVQVLKSKQSSDLDKETALKFIIHFTGDIHQPLHVGRPEDQGGNSVRIIFEGRSSNLHALWDTHMIMKSPMNYEEYADSLESGSFLSASYDLPEISFSQIIKECMNGRGAIYSFQETIEGPVIIDQEYYEDNFTLMNTQLLKGGKRLADLLNRIFK